MANLPKIKSYEQLLGEAISTFTSKIGVDDQNVGSANLSFFETVSQQVYRGTSSVFNVLRDQSVDRATGAILRQKAVDEGVEVSGAIVGTGKVVISDSKITKIQSKIYAGGKPPIIGATTIYVSDASSFPSSGSVYIGRGTNNFEGPIAYTSPTKIGGYWSITLSTPTTKYHNLSESIIVSQGGNRTIPAGTLVQASSSGIDIVFSTTKTVSILDGEDTVAEVSIVSQQPGSVSNVPSGAITSFASEPFSGAVVINLTPIADAKDEDTDEEIRIKIKQAVATKGKGTNLAISSSTLGAKSLDDASTVTSNNIVRGSDRTILYIDDGNGYEEKQKGVGLEYIVGSAVGGEKSFQLSMGGNQSSISKAFVETSNSSPFQVFGGYKLSVLVGGEPTTHIFSSSDFISNGSATAYEICSSINANASLLFYSTTSESGKKIVLRAKTEAYDNIQVSSPEEGVDSNLYLGFPTSEAKTLNLYKNDKLLSKDGKKAIVYSEPQANWSPLMTSGETLILKVDNTQFVTYTITHSDFINEGSYAQVSSQNSLAAWVNVLNTKLIGVTADYTGTTIRLYSNLGFKDRAALEIDSSSTLVAKGMFSISMGLSSYGKTSDYVLSRNTAQFTLNSELSAGDKLTVGTEYNRANIISSQISGGVVSLSSEASMWVCVDYKEGSIVKHALLPNTVVTVAKNAGIVRFSSTVLTAFVNVSVGDRMILWSGDFDSNNRGEWAVHAVSGSYVEVKPTYVEYSNMIDQTVIFLEGIAFFRGANLYKMSVPAGNYSVVDIASDLNSQIVGAKVYSQEDQYLAIESLNRDSETGSLLFVTQNESAKILGFSSGDSSLTENGHLAYRGSNFDSDIPAFEHGIITADSFGNPPTSFMGEIYATGLEDNPNDVIHVARPFASIDDTIKGSVQISDSDSAKAFLSEPSSLIRVRPNDRYFLTKPFDFAYNDYLTTVLDNDASNNAFNLPLYRNLKSNSTMSEDSSNFRAYDLDNGDLAVLKTAFTESFVFDNYKALMKARNVLDNPSVLQDALLVRSAVWGSAGEKYLVGYIYPASANATISHVVGISDKVKILISLNSGAPFNSGHNGTTTWDVTVQSNVPQVGTDRVTYTYNIGQPVDLSSLNVGDYVTIENSTGFNDGNLGTFKVSERTISSFSVDTKSGVAVPEINVPTIIGGGLKFYRYLATTAKDINDYINANLSDYISSSIINDGGITGLGEVYYSSYQLSAWSYDSISLVDGLNYIKNTQLGALAPAPELEFKLPLTLNSIQPLYKFTDGEEVRILPTTASQVAKFLSVLSVSGISTVGSVEAANNGQQLTLSSTNFGSSGAVQVVGGSANGTSFAVRGTANKLDSGLIVSVDFSEASALDGGSLVKLEAQNYQKKSVDISDTTTLKIESNYPVIGQSTIYLGNRQSDEKFFGVPRNFIRTNGTQFLVEKQGKMTCFAHTGVGQNPNLVKILNLNDSVGGNAQIVVDSISKESTLTILTGLANFSECSIGDKIIVGSPFAVENIGLFDILSVSSDGKSVTFYNSYGVSESPVAYSSGVLEAVGHVKEGDFVVIGAPFDVLNRGTFRIVRVLSDSFYIENKNSVEEEVTVSESDIDVNMALSSTQVDIEASVPTKMSWSGAGQEPNFENVELGQQYTFGPEFSLANRGTFQAVSSGKKLQQISTFAFPAASFISDSQYFVFFKAGDSIKYYVWFDKTGSATDPAVVGGTGIKVSINNTMTAAQVAQASYSAIFAGTVDFSISITDNVVKITTLEYRQTSDSFNFNVAGLIAVTVQKGRRCFVEFFNGNAVAESSVVVSTNQYFKQPIMFFYGENSALPQDMVVLTSNIAGSLNNGQFPIVKTIDQNTAIVLGTLVSVDEFSLSGKKDYIYVQDSRLFTCYKKLSTMAMSVGDSSKTSLVFDTNEGHSKINEAAGVLIVPQSKLGFLTTQIKGLDSYSYNTGLIAECNKIVYGDPRDNVTYPGVGAAGAEIFIEAPIVKRVQVAINIRVQTGVPFSYLTEQVRNVVFSVVNSTPVGQSIAISSIISAVNSVQGVTAVSISSPQYDQTHDLISVSASQKPKILDIVSDIIVSKVG